MEYTGYDIVEANIEGHRITYKDKPWKFDHETKVAFTVASFYDLNMVPQALQPSFDKDHKFHCCLCCK